MSDCQDMTTALAREITQGIEGEVEDLGAVFKRMALLKPKSDIIESKAVVVSTVDIVNDEDAATSDEAVQITAEQVKTKQPAQPSGLLAMANKPKRTAKKKSSPMLENQMTLFDLLDTSA